eukprot:NODE_216_length_14242_cov_0.417592.p9 type:complete len:219 gc:universal NODE_216_length_14242_cov_0.417592:13457-14113(+)
MVTQRFEYLYTNDTPDSVKCAKCHQIPERVYRDLELELLFCQNCRSPSSMYDTYLQSILDHCLVMCPNKDCDLVCKRGELLSHLADQCERQVMPCVNGDIGCTWYSEKANHPSHKCQFDFIATQLRSMMGMIRESQSLKRDNDLLRMRIDHLESSEFEVKLVPAPVVYEAETVDYSPPVVVCKKSKVQKPKNPVALDLNELHERIFQELQQRLKVRVQ